MLNKTEGVDLYYLGLDRENVRFTAGLGRDSRHSLGTRWFGRRGNWDYDTEAVLQLGTFADQRILAWTVASNTGYTFSEMAWTPRLSLKANIASGDTHPTSGHMGTFFALFPRQPYFSEANLVSPANFFDFHPTLQLRPTREILLTASADVFFRYSRKDAVYGPGGRIAVPGNASDALYVGTTLNLQADVAINRYTTLTLSYAHFFKGDVVKDAGGSDVDFFSVTFTFRF